MWRRIAKLVDLVPNGRCWNRRWQFDRKAEVHDLRGSLNPCKIVESTYIGINLRNRIELGSKYGHGGKEKHGSERKTLSHD